MVLRRRLIASLSTGLIPLLSASFSHALVIQPVQVKSALGEPFYAEIVLSDLGSVSLSDITVSMVIQRNWLILALKQALTKVHLILVFKASPMDAALLWYVASKLSMNRLWILYFA